MGKTEKEEKKIEKLRSMFGEPKAEGPMAKLGFGPNAVVVEVRRAKRNPETRECLFGEDGNILYHEEVEVLTNRNLTCNAGLEAAKAHLFSTAGTIAKYIALSESTTAPSASATTLPGEITQNGLTRSAATYSGDGTGVCDLSKTFTATGSFSAVQLMGLFDASSAGNMYFEATFTAVALESGDQLTAKWDPITLS